MTGSNSRMKASFWAAASALDFPRGSLAEVVKIGRQAQVAAPLNDQLRLQRADVRRGNGIRSGVAGRLHSGWVLIRIHVLTPFLADHNGNLPTRSACTQLSAACLTSAFFVGATRVAAMQDHRHDW
jgi:hypothetical protein